MILYTTVSGEESKRRSSGGWLMFSLRLRVHESNRDEIAGCVLSLVGMSFPRAATWPDRIFEGIEEQSSGRLPLQGPAANLRQGSACFLYRLLYDEVRYFCTVILRPPAVPRLTPGSPPEFCGAIIGLTTQLKGRTIMGMKEAYEKKLQAQLDEWSAEIDKLKARADRAEADVQLEYYKHIEELRSMQDAARARLSALREAGDDAWEDLKAGIDSAWSSLGSALKSAASRFKR